MVIKLGKRSFYVCFTVKPLSKKFRLKQCTDNVLQSHDGCPMKSYKV